MKKLLSILAVFVLCVFAAFGGVALAIGSDAALALLGIKGAPAEHAAEDGQGDAQDPAETAEDHAAGAPAAGDDKAKVADISIVIARNTVRELRDMTRGVHVMAIGWEDKIPAILDRASA